MICNGFDPCCTGGTIKHGHEARSYGKRVIYLGKMGKESVEGGRMERMG